MPKVVIDISQETYKEFMHHKETSNTNIYEAIRCGIALPEGHFIAICDSVYPITQEVIDFIKNTVFVGNEDCHYCFDITKIIVAESED